MFFTELLIFLTLGIFAGVITGLIPGIHINLISILLLSVSGYFLVYVNKLSLGVFIIAMAVTHSFLDSIPSIFLGAPDADQALNVLPGHKLLMEGKGFEAIKLTVIGSLICLILTIMLIPITIPILPSLYNFISPYIGWILLFVSIYMILRNNGMSKKLWSFFVFVLSGILGIIVLNFPNLSQPLFPMLSGMFGISTLLLSLNDQVSIPIQTFEETIILKKKNSFKAIMAAVFSGSLTGIFPGLGSAQAAIIAVEIVGNIGIYAFMILIGGINTVNFVFSLATLYSLEKARNGAIIVVKEIVEKININELIVFLCAALIAGGIATILALKISKIFAKLITKLNYKKMCISIISLIFILVILISGMWGIAVLIISTAIGMIPALVGVGRNNAMGCLMIPVIIFFLA